MASEYSAGVNTGEAVYGVRFWTHFPLENFHPTIAGLNTACVCISACLSGGHFLTSVAVNHDATL
jgi:hypothetical protein